MIRNDTVPPPAGRRVVRGPRRGTTRTCPARSPLAHARSGRVRTADYAGSSSRNPRISLCVTRCRRYAREKRSHAGQSQSSVERPRIRAVSRVAQVEPSLPRERRARSRRAGRQHAVEHVDPARDDLEDPFRVADAHEVPRRALGSSGAAHSTQSSISSFDSPTASPPSAKPSNESAVISSIDRRPQLVVVGALRDPEAQLPVGARGVDLPPRPGPS